MTSRLRQLLYLGLLVLAACSPTVPLQPVDNGPGIAAFLSSERAPGPREGTYTGADGSELGFLGYLAEAPNTDLAFVYLHGIESHAGWFDAPARMIQDRGFDFFALDRRGSGINRENRGLPSGHADSMDLLIADLDSFVRPLSRRYDAIAMIGLSWGGKLATAYELAHPGSTDALILVTPGFRALVDVSSVTKAGILVSSWIAPQTRFATPIEPEMFTTTPEHLAFIVDDPLRLDAATASFFMTSRAFDTFIDAEIEGLETPILLFLAGRDRIIDNPGVVALLEEARRAELTIIDYPDQTHSIQFDAPDRMVLDLMTWLELADLMPAEPASWKSRVSTSAS